MEAPRTWTNSPSLEPESNYPEHTDWKRVTKKASFTRRVNDQNLATHSLSVSICVHLWFYFSSRLGAARSPRKKEAQVIQMSCLFLPNPFLLPAADEGEAQAGEREGDGGWLRHGPRRH